jgi:hypothetical protein
MVYCFANRAEPRAQPVLLKRPEMSQPPHVEHIEQPARFGASPEAVRPTLILIVSMSEKAGEHVPLHVLERDPSVDLVAAECMKAFPFPLGLLIRFSEVATGKAAGSKIYCNHLVLFPLPSCPPHQQILDPWRLPSQRRQLQVVHRSQLQTWMACGRSVLCARIHWISASRQNKFNHDPN